MLTMKMNKGNTVKDSTRETGHSRIRREESIHEFKGRPTIKTMATTRGTGTRGLQRTNKRRRVRAREPSVEGGSSVVGWKTVDEQSGKVGGMNRGSGKRGRCYVKKS